MSSHDISTLLADPLCASLRGFLSELRQLHSLDLFHAYRLSVLLPCTSASTISALALSHSPTGWLGPPRPSANISALNQLVASGVDPRPYCDAVADARVGTAVAPSTSATYDSHLKQIHRTCLALGECPLPASLDTIRRVTAVVENPSTLRGWLAAWRRLHCVARIAWAGDRDPFLIAIHAGLRRSLGPPPPRQRCRKGLLRRVLVVATKERKWIVGAFAIIAYTFGLRVPSELVRQAEHSLFRITETRIHYGPIRRKGKPLGQTLGRWCVCKQDRLLCVHDWLQILMSLRPQGKLFTESTSTLMREFVKLLSGLAVGGAEAYTSHCFRRGAAVDVLEAHGLTAMLSFGQWASPAAASAYATHDEQTARALGTALLEESEDDP